MAGLVPGVVRVGERPGPRPPRAKPAAQPPKSAPAPLERRLEAIASLPELDEARRALAEALRSQAEGASALAETRAELGAARAHLALVEQERDALRGEVDRLREAPPIVIGDHPTVLQLLEERGLRGADEAERAVHALTGGRLFGRVLTGLRVEDPDALRRLLGERLVLAGGPAPENAGYPVVTVSPDRADLPALDVVARCLGKIGERLLLNGWRRVMVVGVAPRWHALMRDGVDRRVELSFRAVSSEEAAKQDLVVGWNAEVEGDGARPARIAVRAGSFGEFLDRLLAALVAED